MSQVQDLEQAILRRAEDLAAEFRDRANRGRDSILREAAERLRLREAREESNAKALAERTFRQLVQASELKMQSDLDQARWNLVQAVEQRLTERMRAFMQDESAYLNWLQSLILGASTQIERDLIRVRVNPIDRKRLASRWEHIAQHLPQGRTASLADDPIETIGGVMLLSDDGRIRIDHTFEGRLARLRPRVQQVILESLLPGGSDTGNLFSA